MEPFYRLNDYDQVAELTWENGQLGFQVPFQATRRQFTWETANETLESIVQQGSTVFQTQPENSNINLIRNTEANINSCSSFAASSSGHNNYPLTWLETSPCNNGIDRKVRACANDLRESETYTMAGTTEEDLTYNYGSDDKKDDQESKGVKGHSSSTRRSRTAAVHNQSERKRRDRINQKMKILQRLVPNASKTDKASMLDEVIKYLKNLQAHVQMMNYIRNMPQMMVPLGLQQQQQMQLQNQMSLLARASMNMNIGMLGTGGMLNMMHTPRSLAPQSVPQQFLPSTSTSTNPIFPPFLMMPPMMTTASTAHISQQSMNMDLYNKMAAFCSQQANKTTATQERSSPTFQ